TGMLPVTSIRKLPEMAATSSIQFEHGTFYGVVGKSSSHSIPFSSNNGVNLLISSLRNVLRLSQLFNSLLEYLLQRRI
ncbi:hypothetical protein, partial [Bacillus sp. OTU2372]